MCAATLMIRFNIFLELGFLPLFFKVIVKRGAVFLGKKRKVQLLTQEIGCTEGGKRVTKVVAFTRLLWELKLIFRCLLP